MTAGNFVYPFLSLYLTQKAGLSEDDTGFIIMCTAFTCIFGSVAGGTLADFFSRKHVIVTSLVLSGLCYLSIPFVENRHAIVALIALSLTCLAASDPAFNSIIADLTVKETRRGAYAMTYWGQNIGFAIGPLIAGMLFNANIHLLFWGDGVATLLAGLLILLFIRPPKVTSLQRRLVRERRMLGGARKEGGFLQSLLAHPLILGFCLFFTAHSFIYAQTNFAVPLHLHNLFGKSGAERYGLLMAVNGVAVILLTPLIVRLTKKINSATCVAMGIGLYSFAFGIYIFCSDFFWFVLAAVVWSVGEILSVTNSKVFIAERAAPSQRGRYNILLDISYEAGFGLGPGFMGKVITSFGMMYTWIIIVAVAISSSLAIFVIGTFGKQVKTPDASRSGELSCR